ncbi:hypothetical protein MKX03_003156 [Papaver bracteatum]|nr:hypothetical protein MKX03_003156 [Papaver bracteatum]
MYNKITRDIVLWNPATRKSRLLPKSPNGNPPKNGYNHRDFVGLGFDVATKDYKVIQVSSIDPKHQIGLKLGVNSLPKVEIYCLSSDSWRLMDSDFRTGTVHYGSPSPLPLGRSLNGIYFHLGLDYTAKPFKQMILSFDLSKEKYQRVLQVPVDGCSQLEIIGDKLACISGIDATYKVWILNDYDDNTVKELWTETYRFDNSSRIRYGYGFSGMLALLWNGKIGLFRDKTLILYNSVTDEMEDLGFGQEIKLYTLSAEIYKESLVSVDASASPTKAISS